MAYIFQRLSGQVVEPSNLILLLLCISSIVYFLRPTSVARNIVIVTIVVLALISWTPLASWVMRPLEYRFPQSRLPRDVYGIVVLGGAFDMSQGVENPARPALNFRADRMVAFVELARNYPDAKLIFTGGSAQISHSSISEADLAKQLFRELGIDDRRITFEGASRNTRENALFSRRLVTLAPEQHWLLITSAADMPRALGTFRAIGWNLIPVPVDYHTHAHLSAPGLVGGFQLLDWGTHEWLGLLYYRVKGWTGELFPSPSI